MGKARGAADPERESFAVPGDGAARNGMLRGGVCHRPSPHGDGLVTRTSPVLPLAGVRVHRHRRAPLRPRIAEPDALGAPAAGSEKPSLGDLSAEELAVGPVTGIEEPPGPHLGWKLDPPKPASSVRMPPHGYSPHAWPSGFPQRGMTTERSSPSRPTRSSVWSVRAPTVHPAVAEPGRGPPLQLTSGLRKAVGTSIASRATRPAALRSRSGPVAFTTGMWPSSRQRISPVSPAKRSNPLILRGPRRARAAHT